MKIMTSEMTTADVVDSPTPLAPPVVVKPQEQLTCAAAPRARRAALPSRPRHSSQPDARRTHLGRRGLGCCQCQSHSAKQGHPALTQER
jgi:hypothetical protein